MFPNVSQLAFWSPLEFTRLKDMLGAKKTSLRRLLLTTPLMPWGSVDQPLFQALTHLDIEFSLNTTQDAVVQQITGLKALKNLECFAFRIQKRDPHADQFIQVVNILVPHLPPSLRLALVGIMHWHADPGQIDYTWLEQGCDSRVAFLMPISHSSPATPLSLPAHLARFVVGRSVCRDDWNPGVRPDIWDLGEVVLERRRAHMASQRLVDEF